MTLINGYTFIKKIYSYILFYEADVEVAVLKVERQFNELKILS